MNKYQSNRSSKFGLSKSLSTSYICNTPVQILSKDTPIWTKVGLTEEEYKTNFLTPPPTTSQSKPNEFACSVKIIPFADCCSAICEDNTKKEIEEKQNIQISIQELPEPTYAEDLSLLVNQYFDDNEDENEIYNFNQTYNKNNNDNENEQSMKETKPEEKLELDKIYSDHGVDGILSIYRQKLKENNPLKKMRLTLKPKSAIIVKKWE